MSPPDWRGAAFHSTRKQLTTWSKVSFDGWIKIKKKNSETSRRWELGRTAVWRCLSKLIPQTDLATWWRREIHYGRIYSSPRRLWFHLQRGRFMPEVEQSDRSAVTRPGFSHTLYRLVWKKKAMFLPKKEKKTDLHHQGLICRNKPQAALSQKKKSCLEKRNSGQYFWTTTVWGFAKMNKLVHTSIKKWRHVWIAVEALNHSFALQVVMHIK